MRYASNDLSKLPVTQQAPQGLISRTLTFRITRDFEEGVVGNNEKKKDLEVKGH